MRELVVSQGVGAAARGLFKSMTGGRRETKRATELQRSRHRVLVAGVSIGGYSKIVAAVDAGMSISTTSMHHVS
jgi:hypothetical protein